jgi:hypothetical protein
MKNYRKRVFEIFTKLKALDGHREGIPVIEPGQIDIADMDNIDYNCKEEWYTSDIFLANPAKNMYQLTP